MPILNLEIIGDSDGFPPNLAQKIADASGAVLGSAPQDTWVKLSFIPFSHYAENEGQEHSLTPIFVSLIQSEVPPAAKLRCQVSELTQAVAEVTGVPSDNVHIIVEPGAKGRIAFAGTLIE